MTSRSATQVVMLTPQGRGAVASLLVEGQLAAKVVGALFYPASGQPFDKQPCEKIVFGRWQSPATGEELVVCRRDAERVEIHCHGGHAAIRAIIATLAEQGCHEVAWREWVRQSTADPITVAARLALAAAPTERVAAILWDQYTGTLRRALDLMASHIAAGDAHSALNQVEALLAWSALGCHLVEPWKVVLAGRPNVGKSSLINALLGYERAIVHHIPGTTRDIVTGAAAMEGWPVELADTAGLHASTDPVEAAGIRLARSRLATADLVVLVFDASEAWSDEDQALAIGWPGALQVHNKCDLVGAGARAAGLYVSAKTGEGMDAFHREIARILVPQPPPEGQAMPFAPQHVEALRQIRAALSANQMAAADQLLADRRRWASEAC